MGVEESLRSYLEKKASEANLPSGLFSRVHRKAKVKRIVTASALGAALVAASAGGVLAVRAVLPTSPARPAAPEPSLTPIPDAGDGVRALGPGVVVARGVIDGQSWALVAYASTQGLCVDVQVGRGSGGGCGFGVPDRHDLATSRGGQAGLDRDIIHGVVSKQVAALEWRPRAGQAVPIEIIPDPADFGVNFYVTFVDPGAPGAVIALDAGGRVLQAQQVRTAPREAPTCCQEDVLDEHKITMYYPLGWQRAPGSLTPGLQGATEIFSVGTSAMETGSDECPDIPQRALEGLAPTDALVNIQEAFPEEAFAPRPRRFSAEQGVVPDAIHCLENRDRILFRRFAFSDEGRSFLAYVGIGENASQATREEAWGILDSFIVCDPASKPGDCL